MRLACLYTSQVPLVRELNNILNVQTTVEGVPNVLNIIYNSHLTVPRRDLDLKNNEEVSDNVC